MPDGEAEVAALLMHDSKAHARKQVLRVAGQGTSKKAVRLGKIALFQALLAQYAVRVEMLWVQLQNVAANGYRLLIRPVGDQPTHLLAIGLESYFRHRTTSQQILFRLTYYAVLQAKSQPEPLQPRNLISG